jgi:5-carboxymethyl-2-hydroxymuconate isomerase
MPHLVIEYTDNLGADARMRELLAKANRVLMAQDGVFPTGGIRSRAVRLTEYAIADQADDYAFVHARLTIGAGRSAPTRKKVGDELFAVIKEHFAEPYARRPLALSLEVAEFGDEGTWKHNNLHARLAKR